MLKWYFQHWVNEPNIQKKRLILFLGLLYAIDLMNLLVFQITAVAEIDGKERATLGLYSLVGMLIGGIIFSWIAFRRRSWRISLPSMLKWCIIGQAVFMLGQGFFLYHGLYDKFGWMQVGWAIFFSPALGISIAYLLELGQKENSLHSSLRIHRRQRTAAAGAVSLIGLLLAAIFILISSAFGSSNYTVYIGLGIAGLITVLFFDKVVFAPQANEDENENWYEKVHLFAPYTKKHLLNTKNTQLWFPLIFTGLGTYFFFTLFQHIEKIDYPVLSNGDNTIILGVRYLSTFLGSAVALYISSRYKIRKKVLNIYILGQLAVFLGIVFFPIKSFYSLFIFNVLIGFSTSVFMLIILSAAEMTNERIRPVVTILIPALHRGVSVFAFWGLTFFVPTDFTKAITWVGLVVLGISLVSVFALDDTNFEGSLNLDDDDDFLLLDDKVLLSPLEGNDKSLIERYNERIFNYMVKVYGESIYHTALYEFDSSSNYSIDVKDNFRAWDGLTNYNVNQFKCFLNFAKEMLERGDMESLLNYGFEVQYLKGIVIHNKQKIEVPAGYAVFDLSKIYLKNADDTFGFLASIEPYDAKLAKLNDCLDARNLFSNEAVDSLGSGFEKEWEISLKKVLFVRYLESLRMPNEYILYCIYPENRSKEVKVVLPLLAATDKVHIKLPQIQNMLSRYVIEKQNSVLAINQQVYEVSKLLKDGYLIRHFASDVVKKTFESEWINWLTANDLLNEVIKASGFSTIQEEAAVIEKYLKVMNPKFADSGIKMEFNGCEKLSIPSTLILNLAVNSITYNDLTEITEVRLNVDKVDKNLVINFYDNGKGFERILLEASYKPTKNSSTDYFINFNNKIKGILGEKYAPIMLRENLPDKGCRVTIKFPLSLIYIFNKITSNHG
jgi:MFS family permease